MTSRARRWALAPGWVAMCALVLLAALPNELVETLRWPVLLLGFVVAGMPHGALDHRIPAWARGRPLTATALTALLAVYVALTLAVVGLWLVKPLLGLALLLASAAFHWGQGEAWPLRALLHRSGHIGPSLIARGLLMVAAPALLQPTAFAEACTQVSAGLPGAPAVAPPGATTMTVGLAVIGAAVGFALLLAARDRRRGDRGATSDALELLLLTAGMALGDPALAIGLAFVAWHSPRQLARLTDLAPAPRTVLKAAIPPTLIAFAGTGALVAATGAAGLPPPAVAGIALAAVGGLTVPHALMAAWLDLRAAPARPRVLCQRPEDGSLHSSPS